jgi:hypothetical protein
MKPRISYVAVVVGISMALGAASARATTADWTWTLNGMPTGSNLPSAPSAVGYSAADNSTGLTATNATPSGTLPDLNWYSGGYGVCSTGEAPCGTAPEHAMDNNGNKESILLGFGSKVTLSQITFGWTGTSDYAGIDSDVSVLAYTGSGSPITSSTTYATLGSGWQLIGNFANVTKNTPVNLSTSVSASYWLIAAYNTFTAAGSPSNCNESTAMCMGNDYVKLYSVAGNTAVPPPPGRVSEPSALLLFGTALMGVFGLRRREKASA